MVIYKYINTCVTKRNLYITYKQRIHSIPIRFSRFLYLIPQLFISFTVEVIVLTKYEL